MVESIVRHDRNSRASVKKPKITNKTPLQQQFQWGFGGLPAAELLPLLQQHLATQDSSAQWQLIWLNNDGQSVIGLLPKVTWCVYFDNIDTVTDYHASDSSSTAIPLSHEQASADSVPDHQSTSYSVPDYRLPTHEFPDYQSPTYKVIKNYRDNDNSVTTTYMSYADWQEELISYSQEYEASNSDSNLISQQDEQPNYHHGLIGFIGYDIAAYELSAISEAQKSSQPCAVMGHYDLYLTPTDDFDSKGTGWILNVETSQTDSEGATKNKFITALTSYLDVLDNLLSTSDSANANTSVNALLLETTSKPKPLVLSAQWNKLDYRQAFERTQNYLKLGDCYQINLTQAWRGQLDDSYNNDENATTLINYLPALHRNTQAPFAGYLGISCSENSHLKSSYLENSHLNQSLLSFELLSCSPELFFTFIKDHESGKHHIRTKPIKGTVPRGSNVEQDLILKQQLINSDKDRAENVMIVDLLRNDLGKYAKIGSVKVPQLFTIESFSNVHHMVSTITAELTTDIHPLAVLFGSLPAGSITGTPKKRAVEIISELEVTPRGAYCGTMGYMNFDGSGQWNVLIRTLQADISSSKVGQVSLWAGGGITIASDCDAEYQECLDKVGNLLDVLLQAK